MGSAFRLKSWAERAYLVLNGISTLRRPTRTTSAKYPLATLPRINETDIPDHDILLAGFPCQPFSIIGDKQGFEDTRGTLFFDIARILKQKQPSAFLLENVKQLLTHDKGQTFAVIQEQLSRLGYTTYHKVLNALDFGLPQKRERIFIVGFRESIAFAFPKPIGAYKPLSGGVRA